jgi:hypothetical protein
VNEFAQSQREHQNDILRTLPRAEGHELARRSNQDGISNQVMQQRAKSCPIFPGRCPFGGACHACPARVQTKLTINEPGDKYEQEADRVANQVMRMPDPGVGSAVSRHDPTIQRACPSCEEELQRQVEPEEEEEEETVQAKPLAEQITPLVQRQEEEPEEEEEPIQTKLAGEIQRQEEMPEEEEEEPIQTKARPGRTPVVTTKIQAQINALRGGGRPLSESTRAFFEPRFGRSFGDVRLHTGGQASHIARSINARAFTFGRDIAFASGQYSQHSQRGRRLLAHELTHVIQQTHGRRRTSVQRQAAVPTYRDCTAAITGVTDANLRLENGRQRAREYVGAATRALANAPAAGTTYATALNRHFANPTNAQRNAIRANYQQIMRALVVGNFICNSQRICGREQAFWIAADDLIHVCRPFWPLSRTCRAIVLVHEAYHDITNTVTEGAGYRGSANYPAGNTAPPAGQTAATRSQTPDAYAFFAAHIWRNMDTNRTCF